MTQNKRWIFRKTSTKIILFLIGKKWMDHKDRLLIVNVIFLLRSNNKYEPLKYQELKNHILIEITHWHNVVQNFGAILRNCLVSWSTQFSMFNWNVLIMKWYKWMNFHCSKKVFFYWNWYNTTFTSSSPKKETNIASSSCITEFKITNIIIHFWRIFN